MVFCCGTIWAQNSITGRVTNAETNEPLFGGAVIAVGTSTGTTIQEDGSYQIELPAEVKELKFSYAGFESQTVVVGEQKVINIALQVSELEEVVVVAYARQKKVNLTGSVEVVEAEEVMRQPTLQASQALVGLVPGLTAVQSSGQPGQDNAVLRIRGIGTLGAGAKNNPLILIDGIPDDINGLVAADIESISVLKDASAAAIYGSRAANGVILITTKRGKKGKFTTSYDGYVGSQQIAQNLQFLDAAGYMEAFNDGQPGSFSEETIDRYRTGGDSIGTELYPNTDWVGMLFSNGAIQQNHNISIRGGTDKIRAASTISFSDQGGNVPGYNFRRYSGRFNLDFKAHEKLDLAFDLNFRRDELSAPATLEALIRQAYRLQPLFVAINDDGTWGPGFSGTNPIALANSSSLLDTTTNYMRGVMKATLRPVKNLSISVTYSPQFNDRDIDNFNAPYIYYETSGGAPIPRGVGSLSKRTSNSLTNNFNAVATYSLALGEHNFSFLGGYEVIKSTSESWGAFRNNFIIPEFRNLSNGDVESMTNSGGSTLNGLESIFGRINYNYKERYLIEANVRQDASSRFAEGFRTAVFPSFSVGWRVSQESFFPQNGVVSDLKFRASWGQLGNQFVYNNNGNLVNFAYTSLFGLGNANAIIGGVPVVGGAQTVLANRELRWETTETNNVGVDAEFLEGRLGLTAEYYTRTTKDILLGVTIPTSVGLGAPVQNAGEVQNRGYDLSLEWRDQLGDFTYGLRANFSDFQNEITNLGGLDELPPGNTINRLGEEIGSIFGLKTDGLYQESDFTANGELIEGLPVPTFGDVQAGDIKYVDFNEDGEITNDDRTIIGSSLTNQSWGAELFASFKGFDLSVSFIGAGGRDVLLQGDVGWAFFNAGKIQEWQTDYWTPENTDAAYPRLHPASTHPNWRVNETWLFNTTYARLRNVTLGYSLPGNFLSGIGMSRVRVYVTGQNLITWDQMPDGIDPLTPSFTTGGFYPVTRVFMGGVNVSL